MPSAETANNALSHAAAQVIEILAGAVKLKDGNTKHLRLAKQMGKIMSPVFTTHGVSATLVPPVLLSAAMEMQEHLDPSRQWFVSAPVWYRIRADDPRIQQHPLKDKACTIVVSRPVLEPIAGVMVVKPAAGPSRPKPKGAMKKQVEPEPAVIPIRDKGKGKEVVPPEDIQEVPGRGRSLGIKKRKRDSSSSSSPDVPGARKTSGVIPKRQKGAEVAPAAADGPKENLHADGSELVPHCDQCIKLGIICRQGFGAKGALKACAHCSRGKFKCSRSNIDTGAKPKCQPRRARSSSRRRPLAEDIIMEGDAEARPSPALSVPPIATLSHDGQSLEPAETSSSPILDPPIAPAVPSTQQVLEGVDSGDSVVDELRAMTLEVLIDKVALDTKRVGLQDAANGLWAKVATLQMWNRATADLVHTLTNQIASQDTNLLAIHELSANLKAVQEQVNVLQEEAATRDKTLQQAQEQLAWQEQATTVLQDTYNALRHCLLAPNQSLPSPYPNPMYHANSAYSGNHSMMPVSMGQVQAMEGLYFNLPGSASSIRGPSLGTAAGSSGWNASASASHGNTAGSSPAGGHAFGESASGRGPKN